MSATDELLSFVDNGGRRSYIRRRTRSSLFPIEKRNAEPHLFLTAGLIQNLMLI